MSLHQETSPAREKSMTVSIMQPTYLPWMGYFDLIDQSDLFIFLDNVQFERRSWQQRNRIRTPNGLECLTVPVLKAGRYEQLVKEAEIVRSGLFPDKHLRVIEQHYRRCKYFDDYYPDLEAIMKAPTTSLSTLNIQIIQRLAGMLGLKTPFQTSSSLNAGGKRAGLLAAICSEVGATHYLSPVGSFDYLQSEYVEFEQVKIPLAFQNFEHPQYRQRMMPFIPYASVLDLLFNEGDASLEIIRSGRRPVFSFDELAKIKARHGVMLAKSDFEVSLLDNVPPAPCSLLIQTDGNSVIGTGHVMRCLSFAEGWRAANENAVFAMRASTESLNERLREKQFQSRQLTAIMGTAEGAMQAITLAQSMQSEWVMLDGYDFKGDYQQHLKDAGLKVLMVDDYGHAEHYPADLVLNQNLTANPDWYVRRGANTKLLLGARYALLRKEFIEWKDWKREIPPVARKVLVTLGGADPDNVTGKVIESLRDLDIELKVVVGGSNPHFEKLSSLIPSPSSILRDVSNMPELMAWADIVVSAGGTTSYEIAYMGLPNLVLVLADNQLPIADALDAGRLAGKTAPDKLADDMRALLTDAPRRQEMSRRGRELVDGRGVSRVVGNLRAASLVLRSLREEDSHLIQNLANDSDYRAALVPSEQPSPEAFVRWVRSRINNADCRFYFATNSRGVVLGQIYFELRGDEAFLFVNMQREFRGRRYGTGLILRGSEQCFAESSVKHITVQCHPENTAALRALELADYHNIGDAVENGQAIRHFVLHRADEKIRLSK